MKRKATSSIIATVTAIVLVAATMSGLLGCVTPASGYTEEEHIARVTRRARERFIDSGEYTDLEVFPLYDENDELGYFLIELQPSGYAYVEMNRGLVSKQQPMYYCCNFISLRWCRTVVEKGSIIDFLDENGQTVLTRLDRKFSELGNDNKPIYYKDSHFKVANIKDERKYLIEASNHEYVPAIKKGNQFYSLYSLELCEYQSIYDLNVPTAEILFSHYSL